MLKSGPLPDPFLITVPESRLWHSQSIRRRKGRTMNSRTVLTSQHTESHWTPEDVKNKFGRDLETDPGLAEFLAEAPNMARALKAVLNLDLGELAERLVRAEIRAILH